MVPLETREEICGEAREATHYLAELRLRRGERVQRVWVNIIELGRREVLIHSEVHMNIGEVLQVILEPGGRGGRLLAQVVQVPPAPVKKGVLLCMHILAVAQDSRSQLAAHADTTRPVEPQSRKRTRQALTGHPLDNSANAA